MQCLLSSLTQLTIHYMKRRGAQTVYSVAFTNFQLIPCGAFLFHHQTNANIYAYSNIR